MGQNYFQDKRLVDRLIKGGVITTEQHRAFLDGLPDVAAKAVSFAEAEQTTDESEPQSEVYQSEPAGEF